MSNTYELIVVGGGAIGLSAAYNAVMPYGDHPVLAGDSVLVLEQSSFFNQDGSTAGSSRQYRLQYTEDDMSTLVVAGEADWAALQRFAAVPLIERVGCLWFGDPNVPTTEGSVEPAIGVMDRVGIPYRRVGARQLEAEFGFGNLPADYAGFFQDRGGIINIPATLRTLHDVARSRGVRLEEGQTVRSIASDPSGVTVTTDRGAFRGKKVVLVPGPYAADLAAMLGITVRLDLWVMASAYFRKARADVKYPTWFAFQRHTARNANLYYGFPEEPWSHPGYIRVAPDYPYQEPARPGDRRPVTAADLADTAAWVRDHMPGLDPNPEFLSSCIVGLPRSEGTKEMILGIVPGHPDVVLYTAGWAAKFIPLLGKICVQLALTGRTPYEIRQFAIDRPQAQRARAELRSAR